MKNPRPHDRSAWDDLLQKAKADQVPAVDLAALMRTVRSASPHPVPVGWVGEFHALFESWRFMPFFLTATAAFAVMAAWEMWDWWKLDPWLQLVAMTSGGGS